MLIAARNSQDFACCALATASARWKCSSALAASGSSESSVILPAMRLTSASHHLSLAVSPAAKASPMQPLAVSNCPISEFALARYDNHNGIHIVVPVDRIAVTPEVIVSTASEALPVRADKQPRCIIPHPAQNNDPD